MSAQPPLTPPPDESASETDESASEKIRQKIRDVILPQLQQEGKDPSSKDVYPDRCKELAKEFGVHYNTAKKSWDKVLREAGVKPPAVASAQRTVGGVRMKTEAKPKEQTKREEPEEKKTQETEPEVSPEQEKELAEKIFTSIHATAGESLFAIAESIWGVEIERPESKAYEDAGKVWAEVAEAYGWKAPKLVLLVGAVAMSGQLFAIPLIKGRAEALKKAEAEAAKK